MSELNISEASKDQMPMMRHVSEAGWALVAPRTHWSAGLLFRREVDSCCAASSPDDRRSVGGVIERLG